MKVLLLTHIYPPAVDGGSRVISKIGEHLQKNGHEVKILTSDCFSTDDFVNPKSKPINSSPQNQNFIFRLSVYKSLRRPLKLLCLFFPKKTFFRQFLEVFQKGPIFKIVPLIKTLFKIKQFSPSLIVCGPLPTTIILYASLIKRICRSKILINASFHQTDHDFYKKPLIKALKHADFIWSLSQYEKKFFVNNFKIDQKKIINIGNGIDQNLLILENNIRFPKNPNILFIGSLSAHKGLEILINSFSKLSSDYPNLTLTIAGQKTLYFSQIKKIIRKLNPKTKSKIELIFNFKNDQLKKIIDHSTVLVLPSKQESFGLVLIEAMARGKPVIGSGIPPLKELIKKTKGGLVFKTDSVTDLSKKIQYLINNPNIAKNFGLNGLKYTTNHYTWDKIGKKICQKICC